MKFNGLRFKLSKVDEAILKLLPERDEVFEGALELKAQLVRVLGELGLERRRLLSKSIHGHPAGFEDGFATPS